MNNGPAFSFLSLTANSGFNIIMLNLVNDLHLPGKKRFFCLV